MKRIGPHADFSQDGGDIGFIETLDRVLDIRYAMLVTTGPAGLAARPLTTRAADPDGVLWFLVTASGDVVRDVAGDARVLLVYAEPDESRYLGVSGTARVLRDADRARRLWTRLASPYFPGGPDDPELRVLRVDVSSIEVWEPHGTRVGQFVRLAAAAMGADVKAEDIGRHDVMKPPR